MLRLHVSRVKQRYEKTPETEKGANNETENRTRIDFICLSLLYSTHWHINHWEQTTFSILTSNVAALNPETKIVVTLAAAPSFR